MDKTASAAVGASPAGPPFTRFADFYPYYLDEHADPTCRRLHFAGTSLVIATLIFGLISGWYLAFALLPVFGYGFAWVGHFFFEHNRPATFRAPFFSFAGDFVMFKDILLGRVRL